MTTETIQGMTRASDAARKLGVSPRTIKRAVASKQIPGMQLGSLWLVNTAWLAAVTRWPESEVAS